jgi:hypothetical protein
MISRISAPLVLAALAAGCGSADSGGSTATSPGTVRTSAADLAGTYERTLTPADIERTDERRDESAPGQAKPEPGPLKLALEDGTLTMTDLRAEVTIRQDFSATSDGAFRIGAYQAPEQGSFCGPDIPQTAAYTWKRSGDMLALKAVQDNCADRDSILSGRWQPADQ